MKSHFYLFRNLALTLVMLICFYSSSSAQLTITCPGNMVLPTAPATCASAAIKYYPVITSGIGNYSAPIAGYTYLGAGPDGHSYYLSAGTKNYLDARQAALDAGGYLAVIDDAVENTLIQSYVVANGLSYILIGYDDIDTEGTFEWYTGQPTTYFNWNGGEPNNSGGNEDATTLQSGGKWNDLPANANHRYIVEVSGAKTIQTSGLPTCSKFPIGVTTNTFVSTDMLGNTATCSFTVTVSGTNMGIKGNDVSIADNDVTPSTSDDTDFGTVNNGYSKPIKYVIFNTGTVALNVTSSTITGGNASDFVVSNLPTTVAAGGSATFTVTFTPSALGVRNAVININSDDCKAAVYNFAVKGNSIAPPALAIACPTNANLPVVPTTCFSDIFKYYPSITGGAGNYNLPIAGFTYLGNAANGHSYYISNTPNTYINARQAALAAGGHLVVIEDADENALIKTYLVSQGVLQALIGLDDVETEGTYQWYTGQPFSYVQWGLSQPNNLGNQDANIIEAAGWNDAKVSDPYPYIMEVSGGLTIQTAGLPTCSKFPVGVTTNTYITTDKLGNTATCSFTVTVEDVKKIDVKGNGISIAKGDITPSTTDNTDFGSVFSGSSKPFTYTIANTGTEVLNITSIVASGADAANFLVSGVPTSVAAGSTATFKVTFNSPAILGVKNATITITNNNCNMGSYDFAVQANAIAVPVTLAITCPGDFVLPTISGTCASVALKYYPVVTGASNYNAPIAGYTYLGNAPNGHSYYLSAGTKNYLDARQAALDAGGHLVVIDDLAENTLIKNYVSANSLAYILIGYDDVDNEGTFEWYTGQPTVYTNWRSGEPNDYGSGEDATTLQNNGGWNDLKSTVLHRYIVEVPGAKTIQTAGLPTCSKFPVGVTTNTFVTTDIFGNTATCSFTVTVADTDIPVVIAKANVTRNASASCTFVNTASSITEGTATDNCAIASYEYVLTGATAGTVTTLAGQVFNGGVTTVTWRAKDVNGNFSTTSVFTVTVNDTQIPVVTPKADQAFATLAGACTFTNNAAQIAEGISTDNCSTTNSYVLTGATTGTVTTLVNQVFNVGVTTVTWKAKDAAGNVSTSDVFTITITSTNNAEINVVGNAVTIVDGDVSPSTLDNTNFGSVVNPLTNAFVYTIQNTGAAVLNISSITASSIDPTEFVVSGIAFPATVAAGSSTTFTVTFAPNNVAGNKGGVITINNNDCDESVYDFVITGNVPAFVPALTSTPPTNQIFDAASGTCESSIYKYYPSIGGGIGDYDLPIAGLTYLGNGANGHSYYLSNGTADYLTARQAALDAGGHLVVIEDAIENALIKGYVVANGLVAANIGYDDIEVEGTYEWYTGHPTTFTNWETGQPNNWNNQDAIAMQPVGWGDGKVADLYRYIVEIPGARTIQTTGLPTCSTFPVGVTTNTFVTTDKLGNTVTSSFTVTVNDRKNIDLKGNGITIAKGDITPSALDNTDFGSVNTFKILPYTITNSGVDDLIITSIVISGTDAADFAINTSMPDTVLAGATYTFEVVFTAPLALGTKNATITINNNNCENAIYDFAVTANALVAPTLTITCLPNVVLPSVAGTCESAAYKYYPKVTGGGGNFNVPFAVPGYTYLGVATNGNSYYLSTGTANYLTARQAALDAGGHLAVIDDAAENEVIKNYVRGAGLSYLLLGYDDIDIESTFEWYTGQPTVYTNWRAGEPNDFGGNEDATTIQSNGGWNDLPATTLHRYIVEVPVAKTIQTAGLPTCSKFPVGVTTNTFVTTDRLGNTTTCSFTVTVTDSEAPTLTPHADEVPDTDLGVCTYTNTGAIEEGTALDPCGVASYSYALSGVTTMASTPTLAGIVFNTGITTVTWTATDVNGIVSTADVFTVTVNDNQGPIVSPLPAASYPVNNTAGTNGYTNTGLIPNISATSCTTGAITTAYTFSAPTGGTGTDLTGQTFPIGTTTVTWVVTGPNGVTTTGTFTIVVTDNEIPTITPLPLGNYPVTNTAGACSFTNGSIPNGTGTDNSTTPLTYEYVLTGATTGTVATLVGQVFNFGTTNISWRAKDATGNYSLPSTFTVVVTDTELPVLTPKADFAVNSDPLTCNFTNTGTLTNGVATDNCSVVSYEYILTGVTTGTVSTLAGQTFNDGLTTVTWTATDASGNTSLSDAFDVTINHREINVTGNSVSIIDGDNTPTGSDNTDFGAVAVSRTITYTIQNTGNLPLAITSITSDNAEFVVSIIPASVAANSSATFDVTFTRISITAQTANIVITSNDCDEAIFDFVIKGRKPSPAPIIVPTPSVPTGFAATAVSPTQINLAWNSGTQNATEYQIYQDGVLIATLPIGTTTYQVTGLNPNTLYSFTLVAVNRANGQVKTSSSNAKEWTFPGIPYLISTAEVCTTGNANVKVGSYLGSVYRVYDKMIGGTLLLESINGSFDLPYTNQDTVFYISVLGAGNVRGTGRGYESNRLPVSVHIAPAFESVILGETVQTSCGSVVELVAKEVEGTSVYYRWYLNDQPFTAGQRLITTISGRYKLLVGRGNCTVVSQEIVVGLNQAPIAQIRQRNNARFCTTGVLSATVFNTNATYKWLLNDVVIGEQTSVSVTQSGLYMLEVTQNGCKATSQLQVIVSSLPQTPVLVTTQANICDRTQMATLSIQNPENGVTYTWFRNGRTLRKTGTSYTTAVQGRYQVFATTTNSSCSVYSNELKITRFGQRAIYLRVSQDKKSLFLEDLDGSQDEILSVEWYFEGEINAALGVEKQLTPTQDGYYSAKITNQDGCSFQTRTVYFTVPKVPVVTGEEDIKTDVFSIYPNPSKGIFKVRFPKAITEDMQVAIFDATGKVIKTQIFEKNNQDFVIDIQGMAKGIYLVRFNQENAIYSKSIILE